MKYDSPLLLDRKQIEEIIEQHLKSLGIHTEYIQWLPDNSVKIKMSPPQTATKP